MAQLLVTLLDKWKAIDIDKLRQNDPSEWHKLEQLSRALIGVFYYGNPGSGKDRTFFEEIHQKALMALSEFLKKGEDFYSELYSWFYGTFQKQLLKALRDTREILRLDSLTTEPQADTDTETEEDFPPEVTQYVDDLLRTDNNNCEKTDLICKTILYETFYGTKKNPEIALELGHGWNSKRVADQKENCKNKLRTHLVKQFPQIFKKQNKTK